MSKKRLRRPSQKKTRRPSTEHYSKALQAYEAGQDTKASQLLESILSAHPEHLDATVLLARMHAESGDFRRSALGLEKAIELAPQSAELRVNLGEVFCQAGLLEPAIEALRSGYELDPQHLKALDGLSSILFEMARQARSAELWTQARGYLERFCTLAPENIVKRWRLADCYEREGKTADRVRILQEIIALDPNDVTAPYLLAAAAGQSDRRTGDVNYVREVFDAVADEFDSALLGDLNYQVPSQIRRLLDQHLSPNQILTQVLDLGCGTGLVAEAITERCERIHGVDLSSAMIAHAQAKDLYQSLHVLSLEDYLSQSTETFDAIIAGDVLTYVGEIEAIFMGVHGHLHPDALFIFSVESTEDDGVRLMPSGRFAHSMKYIRDQLQSTGFELLKEEELCLRREGTAQIEGVIYVACRSPQDS